jgi:hypothetical protein
VSRFHIRAVSSNDPLASSVLSAEISIFAANIQFRSKVSFPFVTTDAGRDSTIGPLVKPNVSSSALEILNLVLPRSSGYDLCRSCQ